MSTNAGITYVDIANLKLDPENPRLPESVVRTPEEMIDYIATNTSIEDLMSAIAENGFFPGEPLVAVKDSTDYIVVEGNRRLTAVKLILNPELCTKPSARMRDISKAAVVNGKYQQLSQLPVIVRDNRQDILPYLGFRHITGVKQWEPLAKARYIKQLFDLTTNATTPDEKYFLVARAIGSRKDHIKRNLDALAVYKVMEDAGFYGIESLDEESIKFSILSTALADDRIGSYVGVCNRQDDEIVQNHPILNPSSVIREKTEELTKWLYEKDDKGRTKVGESRNLRELAAVIEHPKALMQFKSGASLKLAYQYTVDSGRDFLEYLYRAEAALTEAAGTVATVNYDKNAHEVARRIQRTINMIGKAIAEKEMVKEDNEF